MQQARIIVDGSMAIEERSVANTATSSFPSIKPSLYGCSGSANFVANHAPTRADFDILEKIIRIIGLKLEAEIAVGRAISGSMRLSIETKRRVSIAALAMSNCMLTISNRLRIILNFDLILQMALRFVSDVTGKSILHKMRKRLIRWTPDQIMLRAIPSQALNESSLKV